jgi:hypothetical protein
MANTKNPAKFEAVPARIATESAMKYVMRTATATATSSGLREAWCVPVGSVLIGGDAHSCQIATAMQD